METLTLSHSKAYEHHVPCPTMKCMKGDKCVKSVKHKECVNNITGDKCVNTADM